MSRSPLARSSLPAQLRAWDDEALMALLTARPDLITPVPADLDQLASRACTRSSLARMLDRLDRVQLAVMEAFALLDGAGRTVPAADVLASVPAASVSTLTSLRQLALVWGEDDALRAPGVLATLLPQPGGLGPDLRTLLFGYSPARLAGLAADLAVEVAPEATVHDLVAAVCAAVTAAGHIDRLLDEAGPAARELADRLAASGPAGRLPGADRQARLADARTALEALLARGLLVATGADTVVLPREVGLVVRGGRLYPDAAELAEPSIALRERKPELVDRAAGGAALEFLARVEHLLQLWERQPPSVLKTIGLGVRDLRRTAAALGTDEALTALVVEVAAAAGLIAAGGDEPRYLPTPEADAWLVQPPAGRWGTLVNAWLHSVRTPSLVGTRDEGGRARAAMSADTERVSSPEVRRLVLTALADLAPGSCTTPAELGRRLVWLRPRRWSAPSADAAMRAAWDEASQLGLLGLGGLTAAGRALVCDGAAAAVAAMSRELPEPATSVMVQADLTAVAPGPLEPGLARRLGEVADVESRGSATVYRFTTASIRRGLDSGLSAEDVHRLLAQHSSTPVPQPLTYLIDDVARRHGKVRVGRANTYVRSDDPAVIDRLVADPGTAALRLFRLADTVVVSPASRDQVLDVLHALGQAPVEEAAGGVTVTRPRSEPVRAPKPRLARREVRAPSADTLAEALRRMRAGDRAQAARPADGAGRLGRAGSPTGVEQLTAAIATHEYVWLGYLDHQGGAHDRVVLPLEIVAGRLAAFDGDRNSRADFPLHRITGVARLDA